MTDPQADIPAAADHDWAEAGPEGQRLVRAKLPDAPGEADAVLTTAVGILGRGTRPDALTGHATGLVVGYVQSGKTLSFTAVIASARDNGFPLVVVVAGTSNPLLNQSTRRLRGDLQVDANDGHLRWVTYTNPTDNETTIRFIRQALDEWRDPTVPPQEKATVLITVMKNHRHLANLVRLLRALDLADVPALVVDDEADQASLNTQIAAGPGQQSTTYRRLLELRDVLPLHTFLQYTATPQAPLLINLIDILSPRFVEVLDPGADYVGGQLIFQGAPRLTRLIPPQDIASLANPLTDPPESLLEALRVFLIGVTAGIVQGLGIGNLNRSMLVHPSQKTAQHAEYRRWIGDAFDEWQRILDLPPDDPDRRDLLHDFRDAYDEIATTVALPPFERLVGALPRAFRRTSIEEVNASGGKTPLEPIRKVPQRGT